MWILIAQEEVGSQASSSTDGKHRDRDGQRKCISETGSSDPVSSLPWEIREIVVTAFQERKKSEGWGVKKRQWASKEQTNRQNK